MSFTQDHFLYDSCPSTYTYVLVCTLSVLCESLYPIGFSGFSLISVFCWAMNIRGPGTHTPYCFSSSLNSLVMCMCYMVKSFWDHTWMPLLDRMMNWGHWGNNFYNLGVPFFAFQDCIFYMTCFHIPMTLKRIFIFLPNN